MAMNFQREIAEPAGERKEEQARKDGNARPAESRKEANEEVRIEVRVDSKEREGTTPTPTPPPATKEETQPKPRDFKALKERDTEQDEKVADKEDGKQD